MTNPRESLAFALQKYPDRVELVSIEQLVLETARQNPKRPAYVKLAVPDEMIKALRGRPDERDLLLLVKVPRDILSRAASPIVLPDEVR